MIKIDKINQTTILEIAKEDVERLINALDTMVNNQQRILLENLPSKKSDRRKLEDYKELRENITKILDII
jgi:hypothetical protein